MNPQDKADSAPVVSTYPDDWPEIARRIKEAAGWKCERCKHPHEVATGYVLTVHHLDGDKANCADWNLAALCQRCHLRIQGRIRMDQGFMPEILPVSDWFKPHLAGYLASLANNAGRRIIASRATPWPVVCNSVSVSSATVAPSSAESGAAPGPSGV